MLCPNCTAPCNPEEELCPQCGSQLHFTENEPEEIPVIVVIEEPVPEKPIPTPEPVVQEPVPAVKKGRLWPPLLALAMMICVGTLLFFLIPRTAQDPNLQPNTPDPWFSVENGVLAFHEEFYHGPEELEIPSQWNGQTVTAIADYAFSGTEQISTVILPQTVTQIGDYAFSSCKNLRGIYIPASVTSIGVYAFADCDGLEAIYLPGTLEALGHGSLDSCDGLRYILFNGTYAQWTALYSGYFVSNVELHTIDGTYYAKP